MLLADFFGVETSSNVSSLAFTNFTVLIALADDIWMFMMPSCERQANCPLKEPALTIDDLHNFRAEYRCTSVYFSGVIGFLFRDKL